MLDILIPTYQRPAALAVTLATLLHQTYQNFRVVISDQTESFNVEDCGEVQAVLRVLRFHGHSVEIHKHLPRRGMAEQRQFLLDQAHAPYVLFSDDDLLYEADALERMLSAIMGAGCGFVGCAVAGLSYLEDVRPHQQDVEFWNGEVEAERVDPNTGQWQRHRLHNAANIIHVAQGLGLSPETQRLYKVAWVGGCTLYDAAKLRDCGGYDFWTELPTDHCGEDVLAQLRVLARYGGAGLMPTRVYHQELPTTVVNRQVNAPEFLTHYLQPSS
jgi:glycosyltransferase involved in cell wall biosynthesis